MNIPTSTATFAPNTTPAEVYTNTGSLPYDYEDFGLSRSELVAKFLETGEHEHYLRSDWSPANPIGEQTVPDYWDWVMAQIAQDDEDY
ncbi:MULTISPECIES: hypothetical protein [Pseudomonas syringae group]|uniref:hypothetical protein n=1 Tax=Pseudomonas syringae group TaxID=136849 RepID=UPI000E31A98E|nr:MULTISPECIES: hypothetical protein [Pseudomonas syringae group]